jgi:hypothetical protein
MAFLKQVATRDNGGTAGSKPYHGVGSTRLLPNTPPGDTGYTNWKSGSYNASARTYKSTEAALVKRYSHGNIWRYHKNLKRNSKLGATAMAA